VLKNSESILTDFELGAMNAFKRKFSTIKVMGCLFHLKKSQPKTYNHLEGYNKKIKLAIIVAHPDIFTAVVYPAREHEFFPCYRGT
jgi:hypothetical protein